MGYYSLFVIAFGKRFVRELGYCRNSYYEIVQEMKYNEAFGNTLWYDLFIPQDNGNRPKILSIDIYTNTTCHNWSNWTNINSISDNIDIIKNKVCDTWLLANSNHQTGWYYTRDCMFELMVQLGSLFFFT